MASTPYGDLRTGVVSATIGGTPHILHLDLVESRRGESRSRRRASTRPASRTLPGGEGSLGRHESPLIEDFLSL